MHHVLGEFSQIGDNKSHINIELHVYRKFSPEKKGYAPNWACASIQNYMVYIHYILYNLCYLIQMPSGLITFTIGIGCPIPTSPACLVVRTPHENAGAL